MLIAQLSALSNKDLQDEGKETKEVRDRERETGREEEERVGKHDQVPKADHEYHTQSEGTELQLLSATN